MSEYGALVASLHKPSRATVRRQYSKWRVETGLPDRCDNPMCAFHVRPLEWNGKPLRPILDHVNGNPRDNRPDNLRLLCPNCDSQLSTRGGKNRGRVTPIADVGWQVNRDDGLVDSAVFAAMADSLDEARPMSPRSEPSDS